MTQSGAAMRSVVLMLACITVTISAKAVSIDKFRIRHKIASWVVESRSFKSFNAKTLFELINGGAPEYIENGMQRGFFQRLMNSDSAVIELFAEDFGSVENARKMLNVKQSSVFGMQYAGSEDTSSFIMNKIIGGFWTCGIVGPDYFEFTLTGISDEAKARKEIDTFFDYYKETGKIAKQK